MAAPPKIQRVRKNGTSMCITIPPASGLRLGDVVRVKILSVKGPPILMVTKYMGKVKVRGRQVSPR